MEATPLASLSVPPESLITPEAQPTGGQSEGEDASSLPVRRAQAVELPTTTGGISAAAFSPLLVLIEVIDANDDPVEGACFDIGISGGTVLGTGCTDETGSGVVSIPAEAGQTIQAFVLPGPTGCTVQGEDLAVTLTRTI